MAYRQPAFVVDNALATITDVDDTTIQGSVGVMTAEDLGRLSNRRVNGKTDWTYGLAPQSTFGFDFTSGTFSVAIIGRGHTFPAGNGWVINADTVFPAVATTFVTAGGSNDGTIAQAFIFTEQTFRTWQFAFSGATLVGNLSELWFGTLETLSDQAAVDPGFTDAYVGQYDLLDMAIGERRIKRHNSLRRFGLTVRNLDPAGADFALLERIINHGRINPFWYFPPEDVDSPEPYFVTLEADALRAQESDLPMTVGRELLYQVDLEMLESDL